MPTYGPDFVLSNCVCGEPEGGHRPDEAYYGEERLEGRKSSSSAKRRGCAGYRPAGLTIREMFRARYCSYRWARTRKGDA